MIKVLLFSINNNNVNYLFYISVYIIFIIIIRCYIITKDYYLIVFF